MSVMPVFVPSGLMTGVIGLPSLIRAPLPAPSPRACPFPPIRSGAHPSPPFSLACFPLPLTFRMNPLAGKWLAVSYLRKILGSKSAEDYYDVVGGQCVGDQRPTPLTSDLHHFLSYRGRSPRVSPAFPQKVGYSKSNPPAKSLPNTDLKRRGVALVRF